MALFGREGGPRVSSSDLVQPTYGFFELGSKAPGDIRSDMQAARAANGPKLREARKAILEEQQNKLARRGINGQPNGRTA